VVRSALEATALGLGTAVAIETLQIFAPTRCPQLADVWRNGAGCAAAAVAVAWLVPVRVRRASAPPRYLAETRRNSSDMRWVRLPGAGPDGGTIAPAWLPSARSRPAAR